MWSPINTANSHILTSLNSKVNFNFNFVYLRAPLKTALASWAPSINIIIIIIIIIIKNSTTIDWPAKVADNFLQTTPRCIEEAG